MATNILIELDQQLASLNQLKPPGASKSKISSITSLCVNNIQAESNLVQSLYRALKKAPATHKLGTIYVIDSVVRRWIEQAKQKGQELNIEGRGEPGTYPAAVKRVTELMPALFDDIIKVIPADQKDKLEGMVKIWEKGNTFPTKLLSEFREKLSGESNKSAVQMNGIASVQNGASGKFAAPIPSRPLNTPTGYPPQHLYDQGFLPGHKGRQQTPQQQQQQYPPPPAHAPEHMRFAAPLQQQTQAQPAQDVNSILASLASLKPSAPYAPLQAPVPPQQQNFPPSQQPQQLPPNIATLFGQQGMSAPPPPLPSFQTPQPGQQFVPPPGFPSFPPQQPPSVAQQYPQAPPPPPPAAPPQQADPLAPLRHILPANIQNDQEKLVQALKLLQDLQKDGIPMDQWQPVLSAFAEQYQPPAQSPPRNGNDFYGGRRDRSRSPRRGGGRDNGRGSPVYGSYGEQNGSGDGNSRGRYRQRSPMRGQDADLAMNGAPMQPKYIALDSNLPPDHIKVLSRTLFVGGASGTQKEIQDLFEQFGRVQTCIVSSEKRHAFVKMTTRAHALNAKANMEKLQNNNDRYVHHVARQTKWGVGFGPRECCDYQRGESVIPIWKLTDADVKWLLTAEYGGTGGRKVEPGMVLEEPDIEIGAGVSSKAMSKRNAPETTGGQGHQNQHQNQHHHNQNKRQRDDHGHHHHGHHGGNRREKKQRNFDQPRDNQQQGGYGYAGGHGGGQGPQQMEAYGYARPEPVAVATPPAIPGFGLPFPGTGQGF